MRILIGEISSYKAIVIARYIRLAYPNAELWAYDNKALMGWLHTRYTKHCVRLPFYSLDAYIAELAAYVKANRIDVLLPVHSDYIGAILQHKEQFGHALDWMGMYSDYILLHRKDKLMTIADSMGVRIPKNYTSIKEAKPPFVIKPTNLSSAKGVRYYLTDVERSKISELTDDDICQEYISGDGCGYEVYCQNGRILTEYSHIRLAEWPVSGGSSVLRGRYVHPEMRQVAEKILSAVPWTGFAMFEFKVTNADELVLIEVNPRIWGSINQPLQDGCPLFEHILGLPDRSNLISHEIRTCLMPQVYFAMLGYIFQGKSERVRDWIKHWSITRSDVSFFRDPLGLLSMIIRKIR